MAVRNLLEHRAKTFIIGTIIAVGVVLLIVGNALMETAALGIRRGFIENYTGDIMIAGTSNNPVSLFGVQSPGGIEDTPTLPRHDAIRDFLAQRDEITGSTSQVTGYARLSHEEFDGRSFSILFGIEPGSYRSIFRNITFLDGRDILPGEEGIVISQERIDDLVDEIKRQAEERAEKEPDADPLSKFTLGAGDEIRLTSFGNAGVKIRVVPIVGVFEFINPSEGLGIDLISYVDIQTVRALSGLTIGFQGEFDLEEEQVSLLDVEDLDQLFTVDFEVTEAELVELDQSSLLEILGDTEIRDAALEIDTGSWQYILAKTGGRARTNRTIGELNRWFESQGIGALAADWEVAAGPFAQTADVIRQVFNIAIIIVAVVAIIIMINTLVIGVIERTAEIGTMRALGAHKRFIWRLFLVETVTISTLFGLVGAGIASIIVGILNIAGIPATNVFLRILFAGDALRPEISIVSIISSVVIATLAGLLAHVYPVAVALRIQPIKAIQSE